MLNPNTLDLTMNTAGYNSRVPQMAGLLARCLRLPCALLLILSVPCFAADWSTPVHQLAQKIVADTGPGAVSLTFSNRSSLTRMDVDAVQAALITQVAAAGVRLVNPEQASVVVQISLSENLQKYVWVAQVQQGSDTKVEIVSVARLDTPAPIHEPVQLTIRKILAWSQDERILDVAVIDSSPPSVIVLDPNKVAIYALQQGQWQLQQSLPIHHSRPWPRDLRGRLMLRPDHLFDAYLPGIACTSTAAPISMACRDSDDPWPLATQPTAMNAFFSPSRNFFTGALSPGVAKDKTVVPFSSAAPIPREKYVLWLFAGTDGHLHEVDGMNNQMLARTNWGSDIAAIKTSCGSGWQILATSSGDGTAPDTIRAYEFPDRDPVAASLPTEMNGSVTSLWTESTGNGVMAVSQNQQTGKYEAYRLAIACGQ
jgi:hypothetical protein